MPIDNSLNSNTNTDIDITKGVDNAPNANITQNFYGSDSIPKKDQKHLTPLPPINPNFIGRVDDLKTIEENLKSDNVLCVVNGIGGVGKSELSYAYLHQHKDEYNKIAFIEMTQESGTLEEVFKIKFQDELYLSAEDNFDTIIKRLQNFTPKNLLLIDNLLSNSDFEKIKFLNNNFDILITTKIDIDSDNILNLDVLVEDDARELFLHIYNTDENIDDILVYLDNHPLFIKLIAYSLDRKYIRLEHLRDDIKDNKISKIRSKDNKTFKFHLQKIFDKQFKNEEDNELKRLLKTLALFPAIEIELEMLEKILGDDRIEGELQLLVNTGWLINKENSYKLHQIIKEFMLTEYPIAYEEVLYVLENIGNYIDPDDNALIASSLNGYIPIVEAVLSRFEEKKDNIIASVLDSLTYLFYSLGEYNNALEVQKESLAIRESLFDEKSKEVALSYYLLGIVHDSKSEYEKAKSLHQKALKIREEVLGENHLDTANSYNSLGALFYYKKEYKKTEPLYEKALKIKEEVLGENHLDIAISYNNLALLYDSKGEYEKAEPLYEKALKIKEEVLRENHPSTATSYSNLASLYESKSEYKKSELLYEKALKIREEVLGESHPDTINSYWNLALFYKEIKLCSKAKVLLEKCVDMAEQLDYFKISFINIRWELKQVEGSLKKEKKAKFNKKGKHCKDA